MYWLIDAGNTRIKWRVLSDAAIDAGVGMDTALRNGAEAVPADRHRLRCSGVVSRTDGSASPVSAPSNCDAPAGARLWQALTTASEAVPDRLHAIWWSGRESQAFADHLKCSSPGCVAALRRVRPAAAIRWANGGFLRTDYAPVQLGADRFCALLGARAAGVETGWIVDAGTAITVERLECGVHRGGWILPGVDASWAAVTQHLPRRPQRPDWRQELSAIESQTRPVSTQAALTHGILDALQATLVARLGDASSTGESVILTGGDAALVDALLEWNGYSALSSRGCAAAAAPGAPPASAALRSSSPASTSSPSPNPNPNLGPAHDEFPEAASAAAVITPPGWPMSAGRSIRPELVLDGLEVLAHRARIGDVDDA